METPEYHRLRSASGRCAEEFAQSLHQLLENPDDENLAEDRRTTAERFSAALEAESDYLRTIPETEARQARIAEITVSRDLITRCVDSLQPQI